MLTAQDTIYGVIPKCRAFTSGTRELAFSIAGFKTQDKHRHMPRVVGAVHAGSLRRLKHAAVRDDLMLGKGVEQNLQTTV